MGKTNFVRDISKYGYKCNDFPQLQKATNLFSKITPQRKEDYHNNIVSK